MFSSQKQNLNITAISINISYLFPFLILKCKYVVPSIGMLSQAVTCPEKLLLLISVVTSSINTSNPVPVTVTHACPIASTIFDRWCDMLLIISCFFFLGKCCLSFLFLNVTSYLHLAVNPLYFHTWRYLLIVDFDSHMTSNLVRSILDLVNWRGRSQKSCLACLLW